jgi:tape measure domain-containing protein
MEYRISIIVDGKDNASGPLRNVGSALGNMSQIAGGILGANLITGITSRLQGLAGQAIASTGALQQMQVGMEGLLAREIANTSELEALAAAEDGVARSALTIAQAMPLAQEKAKAMIEELANIAVLSPYQVETVQQTFQTALAFGYSAEEAKGYTQAILNMAAGVGANNEMLGRMSYNFSQIRMQGRVTAVDIRQLAMAGFDLVSVLKFTGDQFGVAIKDHNDFNEAIASGKLTWEQFTESFQEYAEKNFGGASERMSRTLMGLQSTFKDVMTLTMPKLLGPAVEKATGFLNKLLDSVLKFRDAGLLEKWGEGLGKAIDKAVAVATPMLDFVDTFFSMLAVGVNPLDSLKIAIMNTFGVQALLTFNEKLAEFQALWGQVVTFVTPILQQLYSWLQQLGVWVQENILPYISFKDVLITLGIILAATVVPAIISFVGALLAAAAPIALLFAAVVLLRNAWENNWGGIRDFLTDVWNNHLQPALSQLWDWLQVAVPAALQWLADTWNNVLWPALKAIWEFLTVDMMPVWEALRDLLEVALALALKSLAGLWENVLKPALLEIWEFIQDKIVPIFQSWSDGVGGLQGIIETLVSWINKLKDAFLNMKLPPWITPGSPTPLEIGLRGVNKEIARMARTQLPELTAGLQLSAVGAGMGAGSQGGGVSIGSVVINVPPGADGSKIAKDFKREIDKENRRLGRSGQKVFQGV